MLDTKYLMFTFSGIPYRVINQNKMDEEIVRKVIYRKSCLTSRYKQNGCLRSHSHGPLNRHRPIFKNSSIKPCMASTPQQFRRKTIDNSECETRTQAKDKGKTCTNSNGLIENITPIKKQKIKDNFNFIKGITSLDGMPDKHTNVCRNICGESFSVTTVKSPTQNQMLSLDESMLATVDLDSAVKDYCDSQNRNINLDIQKTEHEDHCHIPNPSEGHFNVINDEIMKSSSQESDDSSCKVRAQYSESRCDKYRPLNRIQHKNMVTNSSHCMDPHVGINSAQNEHFQITDSAWVNDSFSEDVISNMDKDIPISNCTPLSNIPLGEKIKRALISNVQKPVTPKPKNVQVNAGDGPQNSSSNTEKLSTFFDISPFFGLPLKVKSLIQKFKGISDLYRKFYV